MPPKNIKPDFGELEPTSEELAQRKRLCDRAELIDHIDRLLRPPAWVYEEIEEAIGRALAGDLAAEIESLGGRNYTVASLIDRWELEEMLGRYGRPRDDPSYGVR